MKEFWNFIQMVFMAVGGWLGWFMGGCDGLLYALIAFVVIDYLTGVMCAFVDHTLSSEVGFRGICRKVLIFLENAGHLGLPVPKKMLEVLEQLHDRGEGDDGK